MNNKKNCQITSERIDDLVLLLKVMKKMGLPEIINQHLSRHWKEKGLEVEAFGVGSQAMEELGFERFGKSEEMAVVGLQEVIIPPAATERAPTGIHEQGKWSRLGKNRRARGRSGRLADRA